MVMPRQITMKSSSQRSETLAALNGKGLDAGFRP
jgi:hypothetical protein